MPQDRDHARSQARHYVMGVIAETVFTCTPVLSAPPTDDPIVVITIMLVVSGALMLVCIGLGIAARIRRKREETEQDD